MFGSKIEDQMFTSQVSISIETLLHLRHPMQYVGFDWPAYKRLSEEIGEGSGLKLTYKEGLLTIVPTSELHELIASILHNFITFAGMSLQKEIISTGSATLRSKRRNFGVEPDLSYFVSKADIHQTKATVEEEIDLAPDIVVEIDIHHKSDQKVEIYAEFGISEFWRYDGERLVISRLQPEGSYLAIPDSVEIPVLNAEGLSEFLARGQKEKQFVVLSDFQNWLGEKLGA